MLRPLVLSASLPLLLGVPACSAIAVLVKEDFLEEVTSSGSGAGREGLRETETAAGAALCSLCRPQGRLRLGKQLALGQDPSSSRGPEGHEVPVPCAETPQGLMWDEPP